jgi:integrase
MNPTPVVPPTSSLTFSTGTQETVSGKRGGRPVKKTRGLFKYRNSKYWWISYSLNGEYRCESTKTTDVTKARETLKQKRREIEAAKAGLVQLPGAESRRVTVRQLTEALIADYTLRDRHSIKGVQSHLKQVTGELGDMRVADLRAKHLTDYQGSRKRQGAAGGTINREVGLLRRAIRGFLEEHRLPVPRVQPLPENVREGFFSRADIEALVKHVTSDVADFIWFGFYTGWRKGEIASLKWDDVDTEAKTIRLSWRNSKNKVARTMALEGALAAILKRQSIARAERVLKGHDSPYVFVRGDGTKAHGRPIDDISVVWRRACKAAGLDGRLFHDLRRSAARNMDRAGVSRHVAMQITGHKTESMYRRYNIVDDADLRTAMRRTQQYLDTLPSEK